MIHILSGLLAALLYAGATALLVRDLRTARSSRSMILALATVALVAHAVVLEKTMIGAGGLDLGFFNALDLAAWVIIGLMLLLATGQPVTALGLGLFPIAAIAVLAAIAFSNGEPSPILPPHPSAIDLHVLVSISAYGVLALAAMQAIVLGIQHRFLHGRQPTRVLNALPPLYVMEGLLFRLIAIGFVLLTLALVSGFFFVDNMFAQHLVNKTVLTMIAWIVFAVLLAGHHIAGWRGPTAVRFTLGGFALLVLGYFGTKLVLELILGEA